MSSPACAGQRGMPSAPRLFAISIAARLPLAMLSIALLVHAEHLTGSFAQAGVVTGAYAVALGVGGPLLGQLVDRRGQTLPLLAGAPGGAPLPGAGALLPEGAPLPGPLAPPTPLRPAPPPPGP